MLNYNTCTMKQFNVFQMTFYQMHMLYSVELFSHAVSTLSSGNTCNLFSELCKSLVYLESSFACIPSLRASIMKRTEACITVAHG